MASCAVSSQIKRCGPSDFAHCRILSEMIDVYLDHEGGRAAEERGWWGDPGLSIQEACRRAMFAFGNEQARDGHQRPFSKSDLTSMGEQLAAGADALVGSSSFDDLYRRVERVLGVAPDSKPLLIYDVTRRLSYRFGLEPDVVYLHAGPRMGANALKPGFGRPRRRSLDEFPTSIRRRLTAAQAEDFLCLAAKFLRADLWD